jgi:hypothetical protein
MCIKVTALVLCCFNLVLFPDDGSLPTETVKGMTCDTIIEISKEQVSAFSWFSVVNYL